MPLNIRDAEDALAYGSVQWKRFIEKSEGAFYAPIGLALLAMLLQQKAGTPAMAGIDPAKLERVKQVIGGKNATNRMAKSQKPEPDRQWSPPRMEASPNIGSTETAPYGPRAGALD